LISTLFPYTTLFRSFEAMKGLLSHHVYEASQSYSADIAQLGPNAPTDEQTIDLKPEEDLISLNALGYALRVDSSRVRRWVEHEIDRKSTRLNSSHRT